MPKDSSSNLSRRRFLGGAAATAGSLNILSGFVRGENAVEKLNIAFIGAGGRAAANIEGCAVEAGENIYALSDVDTIRCAAAKNKYSGVPFYTDWREMLEKEGDKIDAVVVSTPDHLHAVAAMGALKMGKHVYVEKPLTLTISEARALHNEAKKQGVCTQMGNMGHSRDGARLTNEYIQSGAIGTVAEVGCRTDRPIWPQDILRPPGQTPPSTMNWDLWLGPAPEKAYSPLIAPFKWRGYIDYGTGALGDMGAHIIDHPVWALDLGLPTKVVVEKADRSTAGSEEVSYPRACIVDFYFPAKGDRGEVKIRWYDKDYMIPKPEGMRADLSTPKNGCVYIGSEHILIHGSHGGNPVIADYNAGSVAKPEQMYERSPGHYKEWAQAIRAGDPSVAKSNFDVSAPLTETLLLGCIGCLMGAGTELTWDAEKMTTGNAEADKYITHQYRDGWSL